MHRYLGYAAILVMGICLGALMKNDLVPIPIVALFYVFIFCFTISVVNQRD